MINRKEKSKYFHLNIDSLLVIGLIIATAMLVFSHNDLGVILILLLVVALPVSCLLYWLDFRKQNKD